MRKELQLIELVERYLRKELSEEEQAAFELKLKSNESLQNEVESQKKLLAGIERIGVKQDIQTAKRKYFNRYRGLYLFITLVLITTLALSYYISKGNQEHTPIESTKVEAVIDSSTIIESPVEVLIDSAIEEPEHKGNHKSILTAEVENFKLPSKGYQYFKINQNRDTSLIGREGTIIEIKENSFNTNSKELTIRLKEYYKISDIAFSNLTTLTSQGEILETGGMIYIDAISKTGEKLGLRPKKKINIRFPFTERKPDMKIFTGTINEDELMDWNEVQQPIVIEEPKAVEDESRATLEKLFTDSEVFTKIEDMPIYPDCSNSRNKKELDNCTRLETQNYIQKNLKYTADAIAAKAKGTIYIRYQIDEHGFVSNVELIRGIFASLDSQAVAVVKSLPRHVPGKQRGKPISVQFTVPIKFNYEESGHFEGYNPKVIKASNDSILKLRKEEKEAFLNNKLEYIEKSFDLNEKKDFEILSRDIEDYIFSSSNLGWINCDRFTRDKRERINYALSDIPKDSRVRIIFHQSKSILGGKWNNRAYQFQKLPKGEKITIFVLKRHEDQSYICFQETEISKDIPVLEFKKVKSEDIKAYSKSMNEIHE